MEDEITRVQVSDVAFLEILKEGHNSVVFKVRLRGMLCVMKVYHGRKLSDASSKFVEYNLFIRESSAYRRLKANGLCSRRLIPDFYGTITQIDPKLWPDLYMFHNDQLSADAVLIEYIPNMRRMDLSNFSKERVAKLHGILVEFHELRVVHGDPYPRNMMISESLSGDEERVLWIDFDSAQTLNLENLSERNRNWLRHEMRMMDFFAEALKKDFEKGQLNIAWNYYHQYN